MANPDISSDPQLYLRPGQAVSGRGGSPDIPTVAWATVAGPDGDVFTVP